MKIVKKSIRSLLIICLLVPCFSMLAYAANGTIMFTDPSTATGEDVTITGVVKTAGPAIGDAKVVLTYDATYLQFVSGANVTKEADGKLVFDAKGAGTATEHRFDMVFKALKVGTTNLQVESYTAYLASDETLNCEKGSSAVKIAQGTKPVETETTNEVENTSNDTSNAVGEGLEVTVNGQKYTLSSKFDDKEIPAQFEKGEIELSGTAYKAAVQATSGNKLGYLVDEQEEGGFFLYNESNATFSPFEQIFISDKASIILLSDIESVSLPKQYTRVDLTIDESGNEFPAWQDTTKEDMYVVYAVNDQGVKNFYSYDNREGTYQRFEAPKEVKEEKVTGFFGKMQAFVEKHLTYFIMGAGIGIFLLLIILIVLGAKLRNRNLELDELYDEYGIDVEEEAGEAETVKEKRPAFAKKRIEEEYEEEDLEDEELDEEIDEEDYEDDDEQEELPHRHARDVYQDDDDDFKIDFIDLDD